MGRVWRGGRADFTQGETSPQCGLLAASQHRTSPLSLRPHGGPEAGKQDGWHADPGVQGAQKGEAGDMKQNPGELDTGTQRWCVSHTRPSLSRPRTVTYYHYPFDLRETKAHGFSHMPKTTRPRSGNAGI